MATFINCDEKGSECWFRKWQRSFHALRTIIDANSWISSSEEFWFIQMLKYPQYCPSFDAIYWCRHVNSDFPFAALHLWFWIMANILDLDGDCKRHIWFRLNKAVEITAGLHRKVSCKFMQSYVNLCKFMSEPAQLHLSRINESNQGQIINCQLKLWWNGWHGIWFIICKLKFCYQLKFSI